MKTTKRPTVNLAHVARSLHLLENEQQARNESTIIAHIRHTARKTAHTLETIASTLGVKAIHYPVLSVEECLGTLVTLEDYKGQVIATFTPASVAELIEVLEIQQSEYVGRLYVMGILPDVIRGYVPYITNVWSHLSTWLLESCEDYIADSKKYQWAV